MKIIYSNQDLISAFAGCNSLLDGVIKKIEIFQHESTVRINVYFSMRLSSDFNNVLFEFDDCQEYSFYYTSDYIFYNVESFKLFKDDDGLFYMSFDPYEGIDGKSSKDQDYILANSVVAYEIE